MQKTHQIFDKPWKHAVAAIGGYILVYALASWAIDSGRLSVYFAAILFFILSVKHTIQAFTRHNAA